MSVIPKMRREKAGRYVMSCGEERVTIRRRVSDWIAEASTGRDHWQIFKTKSECVEWAYDLLAEYA